MVSVWGQNAPSANDVPGSQAGIHLVSPRPTGDWTMPAGDYANTRFSPLSEINTGNVKNLHIVGMMADGIPHGHEGGPVVVNKTLYMGTPFPNYLIALDLTKPGYPMKWRFEPNPDGRSRESHVATSSIEALVTQTEKLFTTLSTTRVRRGSSTAEPSKGNPRPQRTGPMWSASST